MHQHSDRYECRVYYFHMPQSVQDLLFFIALAEGRYRDPLSIGRHHATVYSQSGEDGIIAEVFSRIGTKDRFFIEIGIGNGLQNNTRLLLEQGWRGIWIDGDRNNTEEAGRLFGQFVSSGALIVIESLVTRENINLLLDRAGAPPVVDFISVDIDQNTSHIWRALHRRSRLACIEYNASLPATAALEIPYNSAAGGWEGTAWFGASLKTLELIGIQKQMNLVGCDLLGYDAFFVDQKETANRFRKPFTAEAHWEPQRYGYPTSANNLGPVLEAKHWIDLLSPDSRTNEAADAEEDEGANKSA